MNKKDIIQQVLQHLSKDLEATQLAANNAHLAAIDDQSIAETQYDTVAIEAGYLAEGQSKRVAEIKESIALFEKLHKKELNGFMKVKIGALVQLEKGVKNNDWLFIAPSAGGFRCEVIEKPNNEVINNITVITPYSPMGEALMNKEVDDEVLLLIQGLNKTNDVDYIQAII